MTGITRSAARNPSRGRAIPRGWIVLGFVGLSWAGIILLGKGIMALFGFISAAI